MGPYEGIRILEISESIAASFGAMLLAELGAEVIKIEPVTGDPLRKYPGFHVWNRSKKSVVLDIIGKDRKLLSELACHTDVIITDCRPYETMRFGLTYEDVIKINPSVVYCLVPPLSSSGPEARIAKNDDLVAAYSALMGQQWSYAGTPVYLVLPFSSYGAALLAAGAVGAGLFVRQRTGLGQQVEVSWLAGSLAIQLQHICREEATAKVAYLDMNAPRGGTSVVYRAYKAMDGWLSIACASPTFSNKLFIALDLPELVSDPRYMDAPWGIPIEHRKGLEKIIDDIIVTKTVDDWLQIFRENDVPCAPVVSRSDFRHDVQAVNNKMFIEIDDPQLGKTQQMNVPVFLSETPASIRGPAPRLGEHNREVTAELGMLKTRNEQFGNFPLPKGPLSGVKVLDLTNYVAGPGMTRLMAELGADVIKVESFEGDPMRFQAFSFVNMSRGKQDIVLDLKSADGQRIIQRLISEADIIALNFRPGAAKRLNLDYESVRKINPSIIYCANSTYGNEGPDANLPGFDMLIQSRCGMAEAQGGSGQEPVFYRYVVLDHATFLTSYYAALAALFHRERSGGGQLVETTIMNAGLTLQAGNLIFYDDKPLEPDGGRDLIGLSAVQRLYAAEDGWFMLSIQSVEDWSHLKKALDQPDWLVRHSLEFALSAAADSELAYSLQNAFRSYGREELLQHLNKFDIPCAPVLTYEDFINNPVVKSESYFVIEDNPKWGRLWTTDRLIKFSATPGTPVSDSPSFGEHTSAILHRLGYDANEIETLRSKRIVQ